MKTKENIITENGITMIALIITILVLLILTSVATSKMSSMRGIIRQSKDTASFVKDKDSEQSERESETNDDAIEYIKK